MSGATILTPAAFDTPVRKTRLLLASLPLFAGLLDHDGTVMECNFGPFGGPVNGHNAEWIGKPFETGPWWNYSESSRSEILIALGRAQKGQSINLERLYKKSGGEMGVMRLTLKPLFAPYDQPDAILVMAVDVTERRRVSDTADRIAHDMAHRLRNSFTAMRTLATRADEQDQALSMQSLSRRLSHIRNSHSLTYQYLFFDVPLQDVLRTAIPDSSSISHSDFDPISIPSDYVEGLLMAFSELAKPGHQATVSATHRGPDHIRIRWEEIEKRADPDMPNGLSKMLIHRGLENRTGGAVTIRNQSHGFLWQFDVPLPAKAMRDEKDTP